MEETIDTTGAQTGDATANAVSVFGAAGAAGDFPVLKAFQEYIDAEQAKARKRMIGLSAFFIVLMAVTVVTFVIVLSTMINRNQALSDRLLDIALKDRAAAPVVVQQPQAPAPSNNETVLKPVLDMLEKMTTALATRAAQAEAPKPAPVVIEKKADPEWQAQADENKRLKELLRAQQADLKREQARVKEAERKEEIERQRRKLYPEYYAQKEKGKVVPKVESPSKPQVMPPLKRTKTKPATPKRVSSEGASLDDLASAVDYFDQYKEKESPSKVTPVPPAKKPSSTTSAPVKPSPQEITIGSSADDMLPFLIGE